jgi:hypothetical protein
MAALGRSDWLGRDKVSMWNLNRLDGILVYLGSV